MQPSIDQTTHVHNPNAWAVATAAKAAGEGIPHHLIHHSAARIVGMVAIVRGGKLQQFVPVRRTRKVQRAIDRDTKLAGYRYRQQLEAEAWQKAQEEAIAAAAVVEQEPAHG